MAKSLAATTAGALDGAQLQLPAIFSAPVEKIQARFNHPYVTFAHNKRADEWAKLQAKFGRVEEGDMFLMLPEGPVKLDTMKCGWLTHKQYWAQANPAGEVLATTFSQKPKPFKEHIEAVILVYLEDRIVPANIQFRTTKCPAAKTLSDALAEASTPEWADKSPAHKETMICNQPFMRFFGEISLGEKRTSKESGLPYKPTTAAVRPTGVPEWRMLKAFIEDEKTQKLLNDAAERFEFRIQQVQKKLVA